MTKKDNYINTLLLENIDAATKSIRNLNEELIEIHELPNDCLGITINDDVCNNKNYKIDILSGHMHLIGYMECLIDQSKSLLTLNTMDDEEFETFLIKQEKLNNHNQQEMQNLKDFLNDDDFTN